MTLPSAVLIAANREVRAVRFIIFSEVVPDQDAFLSRQGLDVDALAREVEDKFISAFVRASKPATACCAPGCRS
jgi:hypothetical protein